MQQTRGEGPCGEEPTGVAGQPRAGDAEPVTLVDLGGAVTRIAPSGVWTREQVRHPSGHPLFITRLERGQLWHRAGQGVSTWAHEVQVGPATVVTEAGEFHVKAEDDGGATITCLSGQVAVATRLHEPLLLEPLQVVAVSADGETCVLVELPPTHPPELTVEAAPEPAPATDADTPAAGATAITTLAARPQVVAGLLVLVVILLVTLIVVLLVGRR